MLGELPGVHRHSEAHGELLVVLVLEGEVVVDLAGVVARVEQQVDRLPLVGHRGVPHHGAVTDMGVRHLVTHASEAEVGPDLPHWQSVQGLVPMQRHSVQLSKVV